MTRASKPVEFHICGANNDANECPHRCQQEPHETQKASMNATMGNNDWNDGGTKYAGIQFHQTTNHATYKEVLM